MSDVWAFFGNILEMLLHIDVYLRDATVHYGGYIYLVLFIVVFCETGLVVTPFLPGDSLLFAGGSLVGAGLLEYAPLTLVLLSAAVIGDAVNFRIGKFIGPPVFKRNYRFLKRKYLEDAHDFYIKHGGKAIILARFVPIIRTFAPFVAGVANMPYRRFLFFNVTGAALWVFLLVGAGVIFGGLPFVQKNFSLFVYGIIIVSVMPVVIEWIKHRCRAKKAKRRGL